jgi:hypothetical protein
MKALLSAALALAVCSSLSAPAHAKDVVVKKTWDVARPAAELVRTLAAQDQYCARGCRYHVPSVVAAQILAYERHPDDFYTWTAVKDVEDSTWFSHVIIRRMTGGRVRVEVRMVSPELGATLAKATHKEHDPSVDAAANVYDLEELRDGERFRTTRVTLTETIAISGVSAMFGSGIVRDRLEDAAKAMHTNLLRPPPPEGH